MVKGNERITCLRRKWSWQEKADYTEEEQEMESKFIILRVRSWKTCSLKKFAWQ